MVKVITYGTYDLLHYGHIRLLERAKALGDYLIVGVTSDDYDKTRGKINNQQTLMDRVAAVKATGIADEIIVEEYEGQKIDDIRRYSVDIFTVGSDWIGKFDYLNEFCKVVYLPRTEGVSSSEIRTEKRKVRMGLVGESPVLKKFQRECQFVNGVKVVGICSSDNELLEKELDISFRTNDFFELISKVDAVYIISHPSKHYEQIKYALSNKKHVLCESPLALTAKQCEELFHLAKQQNCVLMDAIKTAYSTAYARLLLMLKGNKIGNVVSVETTCTSLANSGDARDLSEKWNSLCAWGPTALLPIFQILGTKYKSKQMVSMFADENKTFDLFTKINFIFENSTASLKVGKGIKSEGEMIISGTKGYVYVPAPWWKTDYFEVRYENSNENKRYFYQLDGEGIRYEIVSFLKAIESGFINNVPEDVSITICSIMESIKIKENLEEISLIRN